MKSKKVFIEKCILWYCVLWLLTAIIGPVDIDSDFDKTLAFGSGRGLYRANEKIEYEPVYRIPFVPLRTWTDLEYGPRHWYRCRTRGLPIAPFIIIDEASWQISGFSGWSGKGIIIWFFGLKYYFGLKQYWVS